MSGLSIVIPWANRDELARTLAANAARVGGREVEFVVVDCGGDEGRCHAALRRAGVPVTLVEVPTEVFNKSLALNLGVHVARFDKLLLLDADVILDAEGLEPALASVSLETFVTLARVRESRPRPDPIAGGALSSLAHLVELVGVDGRRVLVETNRLHFDAGGGRGGPGLVVLRREHFVAVDGMNSDLRGWGWEDVDLVARLQLSGTAERLARGSALHLSHGDELRSRAGEERQASEHANFAVCVANYRLGHLSGTFGDDVETCAELIRSSRWTPSPEPTFP